MQKVNARDVGYLKDALALAKQARGRTFPNPMVGAVIVKNGRIIGRGYHHKIGAPHAEVDALKAAAGKARGATLYINLEPCSHWGKTPPCVDAIIRAKIKGVVCCMRDPNPQVSGAGIRRLRRAGIEVSMGGCSAEAEVLNEGFLFFHRNRRPFVAIKFAASLDGKIATRSGDSRWITNERARGYARALRGHYQAILVGINTVLRDDPHLGTRKKGRRDPLRIVLDSRLRIPLTARVLRDENILLITTKRANSKKKRLLAGREIEVVEMGSRINVKALMRELYRREIISVLVEGGGDVLGSFVDARCVDKVYAFLAPILIGGETAKSAVGGKGSSSIRQALRLTRVERKIFSDNILVSGHPSKK
ncbi:riboflavin biosynthesis protein RibD [Candidatus Kaiserbacteria bacterium RIFCSPLOWO2_01_FULL_54_24]|uniref:Riboflavin biosynthesis protein RibD n=1 Tax=Candidatus Kaiserbacteria bacterium RIFCSPLOWO2_01_FULL_54_24 TaxID=1798515 RepID=A0A1F6EW18_9BACT|nr:MAG: riboflavin biosynthesis protein RibD [Candidatus Kaiserbacteria bacterium RIFCSPLOWO2_01_FULL_54_24]